MNRYRKGADKERKIVREARDQGLIAFRSAGSHSPIDVCIIDIENKVIEFIQSKSDSFSNKAKERLEEELKDLNNNFEVQFYVK